MTTKASLPTAQPEQELPSGLTINGREVTLDQADNCWYAMTPKLAGTGWDCFNEQSKWCSVAAFWPDKAELIEFLCSKADLPPGNEIVNIDGKWFNRGRSGPFESAIAAYEAIHTARISLAQPQGSETEHCGYPLFIRNPSGRWVLKLIGEALVQPDARQECTNPGCELCEEEKRLSEQQEKTDGR